jgi:hypothetical protein
VNAETTPRTIGGALSRQRRGFKLVRTARRIGRGGRDWQLRRRWIHEDIT